RLQWTLGRQCRQRCGVVIEHCRMRILGRQEANQQLIEVHAAEQRVTVEPVRKTGTLQTSHALEVAATAKLGLERHERTGQRSGLAPRATQHRTKTPLRREEVDQRTALAIGATVQDEGRLGGNGIHGSGQLKAGCRVDVASYIHHDAARWSTTLWNATRWIGEA